MPKAPTSTADDIAENIRSLIDRMVDAKLTTEMARRGQELAGAITVRGSDVGVLAGETWRETAPARRDAAKRLSRAIADAGRTWRRQLRPALRDLWKQRAAAVTAAGAAVPASKEIVDTAAVRLGLKRREERHWGAFLLGLLLGAAAGAVVAMLTTPKRGSEMRRELASRADELASRARETEWVPIFQRETNGHAAMAATTIESATSTETSATTQATGVTNLEEAAIEAGAAGGEVADRAAAETAEAINEAYEPDRQPPL